MRFGDPPDGAAPPAADQGPQTVMCDYAEEPEPKPHAANRVRVSGGATCEAASELFFHPAPNENGGGGSIAPKPLPGWVCDQRKQGPYGPVAFDCSNGTERVQYLFH
jgi:hypothetical protein